MNEESGFLKVPVAGETLYKITLLSTNEAFYVLFGAKSWQLSNTVHPCINRKIFDQIFFRITNVFDLK